MEKIDFKKELKHLYQPSAKEVVQVDVPTMNYFESVRNLVILGLVVRYICRVRP